MKIDQERLEEWIRSHVTSFDNRDDAAWLTLESALTYEELASQREIPEGMQDLARMWGTSLNDRPTMGYRWIGNPKRDDFVRKNAKNILKTRHLGRIRYCPLGSTKPDFIIGEAA
jgi:hypothetical protein